MAATWAQIPSWVEGLVAARPYRDRAALESAADLGSREWTAHDLDHALGHHPRIGHHAHGAGAEAAASRREQSAMSTADPEVVEAMARGNEEYERRFGRVFLIRAAGRSGKEMLGELRRRLGNAPEDETQEAIGQLREIALLRLRTEITEDAADAADAAGAAGAAATDGGSR